jgi:hypothetical protein
MPIVAANGINLAYDEVGDAKAPVILLVMGLGTQMIAWPETFCRRQSPRVGDDTTQRGPTARRLPAPGLVIVSQSFSSVGQCRARLPDVLARGPRAR